MRRIFIDTNIIVRILTDDPPDLAARAASFIDNNTDCQLVVSDLIAAEVVFVLQSFYKVSKGDIAKGLEKFFEIPQIVVENHPIISKALNLYVQKNIDYAEAYLAAYTLKQRSNEILSFDKDLDKLKEIQRIEP